MVAIKIAKDLDIDIDVTESRIEQLKRELYSLEKTRDTHKLDVATYYDQKFRTEKAIENLEGTLEDMRMTRADIGDKIKDFEGLEYKVAVGKFIEGKKLEDIAEELGYSYIHIARISAKIKLR